MKRIIDLVHQLETDKRVISIAALAAFRLPTSSPQAFPVSWSPMAMPTWQRVLPGKSRSGRRAGPSCIPHRQKRLCVVPAAAHGPVILADIADSGAGGTAGDATVTFKTLLDMGARRAAVCSISDQGDRYLPGGRGRS